jgi:neuropeptide Y receptor
LNIFNILSDSKSGFMKPNYVFYLINTICILFAMSSAVSNPFLYGFLNENFKRPSQRDFNETLMKINDSWVNFIFDDSSRIL